jgi:hypothetical protein
VRCNCPAVLQRPTESTRHIRPNKDFVSTSRHTYVKTLNLNAELLHCSARLLGLRVKLLDEIGVQRKCNIALSTASLR